MRGSARGVRENPHSYRNWEPRTGNRPRPPGCWHLLPVGTYFLDIGYFFPNYTPSRETVAPGRGAEATVNRGDRKHRHQDVSRFLREAKKAVPKQQEIHIVLDNYATHKHEKVLA